MAEIMSFIDLTKLLEAAILIIFALMARYFIPWLKTTLSTEQLNKLKAIIQIGVYAAEKFYGAGHGHEKLAYVKNWLESKGFTVDEEQLKMLVDAEIKKMEIAQQGKALAK